MIKRKLLGKDGELCRKHSAPKEKDLKAAGIPIDGNSGKKKSFTLKGEDGSSSLGILSGAQIHPNSPWSEKQSGSPNHNP